MRRSLAVAWMLSLVMAVMFQAVEVRAAEPLPEAAVVVVDDVVAAPVAPAVPAAAVAVAAVAVETPAPAADVDPPWYLEMVETVLNYIWEIIGALVFGWLYKKAGEKQAYKEAIRALEAGVNDVWYTVVKDLKDKAQDGKLSKDEKANARLVAREKAKEVATKAGKKILASLGTAGMNALMEKIIRRNKATPVVAPVAAPVAAPAV